jgi:hypothetical protein
VPRGKVVYLTDEMRRGLKILAARCDRSMGQTVEELATAALAGLADPWTSPEGLWLQQEALAGVWDGPALDVYNDD